MSIECHDSMCMYHRCHSIPDDGPFCDEFECHKEIIATGMHNVLHVLRNPYGWTEEQVRAVRLAAADYIERSMRKVPYQLDPVSMGEAIAVACTKGKWSLVSPDGKAWLGKDLPTICTVALAAMGGTLDEEIRNGTTKE